MVFMASETLRSGAMRIKGITLPRAEGGEVRRSTEVSLPARSVKVLSPE